MVSGTLSASPSCWSSVATSKARLHVGFPAAATNNFGELRPLQKRKLQSVLEDILEVFTIFY